MNDEEIENVITKLLDDLISTIPYEESVVIDTLRNHSIIAGGCIASLMLGEEINDYDIFFDSKEAVDIVTAYYLELGIDITRNGTTGSYLPLFHSHNAISLSNDVQLIKKFYGTPEDVVREFDFVHCRGYYYQGKVDISHSVRSSVSTKTLAYSLSDYPINSLVRAFKFVEKGWKLTKEDQISMGIDVARLDIADYDVLCEQLQGISAGYLECISAELEKDLRKGSEMLIGGIDADSVELL